MLKYVPSNLHTVHIIAEGYTILRQRFGNDSFWLHGPYHYIMKAIFQGEGFYRAFSLHPFTSGRQYISCCYLDHSVRTDFKPKRDALQVESSFIRGETSLQKQPETIRKVVLC
jgi:hypothetical protein